MQVSGNQDLQFTNKRICITGASSGIGRATSLYLLNMGAKVGMVGRDIASLKEIGDQFPGQAIALQCDLAVDKQQYDMAVALVEFLGGLDILINAAGCIFEGDIVETFPQDFDYVMDINLRAVFHLTQLFSGVLSQSQGIIVGNRPISGLISYAISKAGVEMLTKATALELSPFGVRVNAVVPCYADTNLFAYAGLQEIDYDDLKKRAQMKIPLGRLVKAEEVAKAIIFLCSQESKFITGHIMKIDGGHTLTSSSYVPWFGINNMNAIFEPTSVNYTGKLQHWITNMSFVSSRLIDSEYERSGWAIRHEDAHVKVQDKYQKIEHAKNKLAFYEEMMVKLSATPSKAFKSAKKERQTVGQKSPMREEKKKSAKKERQTVGYVQEQSEL